MSNPFDTLGLPRDATPEEVEKKWRTLRSELHPDKGGDPQDFIDAKEAYDLAIVEAKEPKPCVQCGGSGYVMRSRGFSSLKLPCETCDGTGVNV
jgi:molecular chaperone DnaJ